MADKLLKSIKFPTLPDRYVIGDTTLTEEGAAAEAKAVGDALATKADTKGTYEDLIAGGAEQLMADGCESDSDPYLFRTTGGSADVGNREYLDKIVGGTVAWNQLVDNRNQTTQTSNGVTFTVLADGRIRADGTATAEARYEYNRIDFLKDHVYVSTGVPSGASSSTYYIVTTGGVTGDTLKKYTQDDYWTSRIVVKEGITVNNLIFSPTCIDLTALLNPTIADYIYSLEQATAGAGVAWFRNYFPDAYYPYDPGTLRSVEGVSAHETVGFNQWDEEWENGQIYSTGGEGADANSIRSKNYNLCVPNTVYHGKTPSTCLLCWYDADKNFISRSDATNANVYPPSNAHYFRINCPSYGTTYNHDICINLSDPSRNGEYEPYTKHTYPLDSSLTLRGVPKLVDGKLAFDGDVYPPSGEVQRRYGLVDLGTLTPIVSTLVTNGATIPISDAKMWSGGLYIPNGIVLGYTAVKSNENNFTGGKEWTIRLSTNAGGVLIADPSWAGKTASEIKASLNGVYYVYEKATPTTETAEGYEHYQICDPSGTEEFVTTGIVPVGHETRYPHDLKKKIETAPDSPSTDGTYLMKRSGGKNSYMALPSTPSANGAYVLTVTVSGGNASYSWTAKE